MARLHLELVSLERSKQEWEFISAFAPENGFSNPAYGLDYETYRTDYLPKMLASANGIEPDPNLVPQSSYIFYYDDTPIGLIKIRHRLNEFLRKTGYGHIGYGIARPYRGKGYAKEMLRQGLEILRAMDDFDDEYILLSCDKTNIASFKTQIACGGITYRDKNEHLCQIFPGKSGLGFSPSDFDPLDASITPFETDSLPPFPEKLVICFFHEQITKLLEAGEIQPFTVIRGENVCPFYRYKGKDVLLMPGFVGSCLTGGFLEEAIAAGVKHVLCIGGAGVLKKDMPVTGLLLIEGALREEGFSYHYMPKSRKILANRQSLRRNAAFLDQRGFPYSIVTAYTTDAFYRETRKKIESAKADGASCIEMEQAGLIALSIYRGIDYSAILYGGDSLADVSWDSRAWKSRSDIRAELLALAKDILESL